MQSPAADWIAQRSALDAWLQGLEAGGIVALDTEFMRRNTFYPQLALLQLGWQERYALVDPLSCDLAGALQAFEQDNVITLMHSASEDLETLAPWLPQGPRVLFDTQIAAAMVGMGLGMSYRALVAELAGAELDKGETRSDWLQRPLTPSQRSYATLDVVYLPGIHQHLSERLEQLGRSAWHTEDCERLKRKSAQRNGDPQPQLAMRGASEWPLPNQAVLRRVLLWRDATARKLDRPRSWLLEDALAMNLAGQLPRSQSDLDQRCNGQRALRAAQRVELLELLQQPLSDDEIRSTRPVIAFPQGKSKQAVQAMKDVVEAMATELDIPSGLLCARKLLEEFAVTGVWPETLDGWRRPLLHDPLTALLPD